MLWQSCRKDSYQLILLLEGRFQLFWENCKRTLLPPKHEVSSQPLLGGEIRPGGVILGDRNVAVVSPIDIWSLKMGGQSDG